MKVLLTGQMPAYELAAWRVALSAAMPEADWLDAETARQQSARPHVAVVANPPPGALAEWPQLEFVQSLWAGVDRLLADASVPAHVPIARMVDPAMTAAMVETALWATLSLHRGFFDYQRQQREGLWRAHAQRRADEVRVLILGLGEMGQAVAHSLHTQGYAMQGWRLHERTALKGVDAHAGQAALWPLLSQSEIVINLLPLTPNTRGLLNQRFFAALPAGAALVNLARGSHVVDEALLQALDGGHLRHAVLDVFQAEPLAPDHRYWQHPAVTLLPHAAALTDERSAAVVVARNLRAFRDGTPLAHVVDRQRGY